MKRDIKSTILNTLTNERACALIGPRQVGKSYILKEIIRELKGNYITLDDPIIRDEIKKDPLDYLRRFYIQNQYLFIDEPAKVPYIFDAIKILIDEKEGSPSKICIANSGNYLFLRKVKESLAGRVSILSLLPFSWNELSPTNKYCGLFQLLDSDITMPKNIDYIHINRLRNKMLVWGGYPIPNLASNTDSQIRWIRDYLATYVFPILIEQFQIRNLDAFERFARLIFVQSSNLLNKQKLAISVGVSQPTVSNFLYQLKAMMLVITLEIYHRNPTKRLVKQNKIHAIDPLLIHNALNTNFSNERAKELQFFGNIYESFIVIELHKILYNTGAIFDAYYWRTQDGAEVDLILEIKGKVLPFEIKSSPKVNRRDASGLMSFLSDHPQVKKGYIIYPGREIQIINDQVIAIPDWWLFGY